MRFDSFPREVGLPRRPIHNKKDYLDYVNRNNGKKNAVYTTVYSFIKWNKDISYKADYNTAIINQLFFDFDDKECDAYFEAKKLHDYCTNKNIKHSLVMSGRGYHVYIYTKLMDYSYKKDAVKNAQMFFINKLNLKCDKQVVGDISRLTRIPNTYNGKGKRFCIPLSLMQFIKGDAFIKILAVKQNFINNIFIGNKLFDMTEYDIQTESTFTPIDVKLTSSDFGVDMSKIPICMQHILSKREPNYKERYLLILYLKEKGYMKDEILEVLKKCLSERKLYHCIKEEQQLQYLFERDDLVFPCCDTIKSDGYCPTHCNFYNNAVYK